MSNGKFLRCASQSRVRQCHSRCGQGSILPGPFSYWHFCDFRKLRQAPVCDLRDIFHLRFAQMIQAMRSVQDEQRAWLARKLKAAGRGAKSALAKHLQIRPDAISRMLGDKENRQITVDELSGLASFFGEPPPGMILKQSEMPAQKTHRSAVIHVPLLDRVSAGKLRHPTSQIPIEDVPLLAFADLGRGEWFALTVDGDSMDRFSPDGSTIVVNKSDRNLISGKPYIFSVRGETTYKIWRPDPARLAPWSTNPTHEPIFVKSRREAEAMVIGRVKRTVLDL